jgi:aspartate/glutamate racemase
MMAAPSALVSLRLQAPVRRFEQYEAAVQAIAGYQAALCENASGRRSNGLTVTDQDQPEEAFCLFPERPLQPPLAIVGGMGPLAGAMAFRRACERFRNSRIVVLYQACSIPDRSTVILGEGVADAPLCHGMALRLAGAVRLAVGLAGKASQPVHCILACNSAHYFWSLLRDDLRPNTPGRQCEVEMVSLVESSLEALKFQSCRNALLLATEGARVGRVFSAPFREAGIAFEEPSPKSGRLLMRTIFEGMKSLDERRAVVLGNEFFENILRTGRDYDCVLAGCTEIPLTIDLLRLRGSRPVAAFLSRVKIVDPMEEALCRA